MSRNSHLSLTRRISYECEIQFGYVNAGPDSMRKSSRVKVVVVAQLVERSLLIPEVHGLNPVIGKNLYIYWTFVYCQLCIEKMKIKKKKPVMAHLKKYVTPILSSSIGHWNFFKLARMLKESIGNYMWGIFYNSRPIMTLHSLARYNKIFSSMF